MNTIKHELLVPSLFEGDIFNLFFKHLPSGISGYSPDPYDIWHDEDGNTFLEYALVGFDEKDIKVSVVGQSLKVVAEKKETEEGKEFVHKKISRRSVQKSFSLHESIDKDKIEASYKNGLLKVKLPKLKKADHEREIKLLS